jgi:hypothetical protein
MCRVPLPEAIKRHQDCITKKIKPHDNYPFGLVVFLKILALSGL